MLSTEKSRLIRVLLRSLRSFGNGLEFLAGGLACSRSTARFSHDPIFLRKIILTPF